MKKIAKIILNKVISGILFFIRDKSKKSAFMGFISKKLMDKKNEIEYDPDYDMYWLKNNGEYLYLVNTPYFNFSKKKLYNSIEKIACKYYTPKKGDVIIDVGAGIGTETLFFNEKIQRDGKIYSIEASTSSYHKLVELCYKNDIKVSENLNIAITDHNQEVWIEETDNYQVDFLNKEEKGIKVDGITLDHLVKEKKIETIDFLKVNIEGSELQMIDGMEDAVKITKNIAVSCHDFLFGDKKMIRAKVTEFLRENNFQISYNNTGHEVVDSWIYGKQI